MQEERIGKKKRVTQARDERGGMAEESNLRRGGMRGEAGEKLGMVCEDP